MLREFTMKKTFSLFIVLLFLTNFPISLSFGTTENSTQTTSSHKSVGARVGAHEGHKKGGIYKVGRGFKYAGHEMKAGFKSAGHHIKNFFTGKHDPKKSKKKHK